MRIETLLAEPYHKLAFNFLEKIILLDKNIYNLLKEIEALDRRIKRGTRSIAVFNDSSETGLKYLFDIEDTYGARLPQHWQLEERNEDDLNSYFRVILKKSMLQIRMRKIWIISFI